jgi:DNA-binding NtrC family response regulator
MAGQPLSPKIQPNDRIHTTVNNSNAPSFAFIIDDELDICQLVATTLSKLGIESATFSAAKPALATLYQRWPVIIFLDIALDQSDAYDVIRGLSEKRYGGTIQLMSGGKPWLLKSIQGLATRYALTLSPPLQKPFQGDAIRAVIERLGLTGTGPPLPDPDY